MVSHSESVPAEEQEVPKYWEYDAEGNKVANPTGQIDPTYEIPRVENGKENWRDDGY